MKLRTARDNYIQDYRQMIESARSLEAQVRAAIRRLGPTPELREMKKFMRERRKALELMITYLGGV